MIFIFTFYPCENAIFGVILYQLLEYSKMRHLFLLIILTLSLPSAFAQDSIVTDSITATEPADYQFHANQLILPASLLTLGTLGTINHNITFSNDINKLFIGNDRHHTSADDYLRFVPSVAHLTLGFIPGVKAKHNFTDRLLASATAHAAMLAVSYGLKFCVNEDRPDGSSRHSFPSGHAALAFTGAELTRIEYGNYYGLAAYATSITVSVLRLHNNRHWFNDLLMGAGIGILCARAGYWLVPCERRLFHLHSGKSNSPAIAALPAYDPASRSMQMAFVAVF